MLKCTKIVSIGAQIMEQYLLSLASSFNVEKLLTTAACTPENRKVCANAKRPTPGVGAY